MKRTIAVLLAVLGVGCGSSADTPNQVEAKAIAAVADKGVDSGSAQFRNMSSADSQRGQAVCGEVRVERARGGAKQLCQPAIELAFSAGLGLQPLVERPRRLAAGIGQFVAGALEVRVALDGTVGMPSVYAAVSRRLLQSARPWADCRQGWRG